MIAPVGQFKVIFALVNNCELHVVYLQIIMVYFQVTHKYRRMRAPTLISINSQSNLLIDLVGDRLVSLSKKVQLGSSRENVLFINSQLLRCHTQFGTCV